MFLSKRSRSEQSDDEVERGESKKRKIEEGKEETNTVIADSDGDGLMISSESDSQRAEPIMT